MESSGPGWQAVLKVNLLGALVGARLAAHAMTTSSKPGVLRQLLSCQRTSQASCLCKK